MFGRYNKSPSLKKELSHGRLSPRINYFFLSPKARLSLLPKICFRRVHLLFILVCLVIICGSKVMHRLKPYGPIVIVRKDDSGLGPPINNHPYLNDSHAVPQQPVKEEQNKKPSKNEKGKGAYVFEAIQTLPEPKNYVNFNGDGCAILYCKDSQLCISVYSSLMTAVVCVNGSPVISHNTSNNGLNLVQIDPINGNILNVTSFDTGREDDGELVDYIEGIPEGTVVAVAAAKEASYSLKPATRAAFARLSSWRVDAMQIGWMWALIGVKGEFSPSMFETVQPPPALPLDGIPATVATCLRLGDSGHQLKQIAAYRLCQNTMGRQAFCKGLGVPPIKGSSNHSNPVTKYDDETVMASIDLSKTLHFPEVTPFDPQLSSDYATYVPIAILGGNRANYLIRCLLHLFEQPGVKRHLITVYTDGMYEEMGNVARVFGVRMAGHTKTRSTSTKNEYFRAADQITQHYRFSFEKIFEFHPDADYAIILEEDLEVSPDFLHYFSQTIPLLAQDPSLLTVSAWNDNSYTHSSADPAGIYRTEFFPGLGWVLQKKTWEEVEPLWPECCEGYSWDLWFRHKLITKGKHVIIPDISRTYHFGRKGSNVDNDFFFIIYFYTHSLNKDPYVRLNGLNRMLEDNYDEDLENLFTHAHPVLPTDDFGDQCPFMIPSSTPTENLYDHVYVLWYAQSSPHSYEHLESVVACLEMWDLGKIRGIYKGVLRAFYNGNHILLAGAESEFARRFMPVDAIPFTLKPKIGRIPNKEHIATAKAMRKQIEDI